MRRAFSLGGFYDALPGALAPGWYEGAPLALTDVKGRPYQRTQGQHQDPPQTLWIVWRIDFVKKHCNYMVKRFG
jgi:hypothetical protein